MCGPGNFAADEGCEVCPVNTYNDKNDEDTGCTSCPVGMQSVLGSTSVDQCDGEESINKIVVQSIDQFLIQLCIGQLISQSCNHSIM